MRAMCCVLLVACGAPSAGDSALVMLSEPARLAGAEVTVDGIGHAPVLPMTVPVGESFTVETPDGPLDVALGAGDVLFVDGADARLEWLVIGADVGADRLALRVDGSPWEVADLLGAEDLGADGEYVVIEGPDVLWSAADREVPEIVEALPVDAYGRRVGGAARDFGRVRVFDFDDVDVAGALVAPVGSAGASGVEDGEPVADYGIDAPWPVEPGDYGLAGRGIGYADLLVGDGDVVEPHARIVVHYVGWLEDGQQIDSSFARGEPVTFPLDRLILGWSEGLLGMRVGGVRQLVIPPEAAYGDRDTPLIPARSTLVFTVHLFEVHPPGAAPGR